MTIKRFLSAVLITVLATVSSLSYAGLDSRDAQSAGFNTLTEQQKAELLKQIADKAAANKAAGAGSSLKENVVVAVNSVASKDADQWLNFGERIGQMIGGAAKELGVGINTFLQSPAGLLTASLIVWHFAGSALVHVFAGIAILLIGIPMILYYARRYTSYTIEYDTTKTDIFGRSIVKHKHRSKMDSGDIFGFMVATAIVFGAFLITVLTF